MKYWSILLVIVFALPLLAYAYMGSFMRYSGDDYCYAWILGQNGFWKAQVVSYFQVSTYNGNRYALTFFSGLADLYGPIAARIGSFIMDVGVSSSVVAVNTFGQHFFGLASGLFRCRIFKFVDPGASA